MKNIILLLILLFTGCTAFPLTIGNETRIIDVQNQEIITFAQKGYKLYEKAWSEGKVLFVEIDQIPGLNIVEIKPIYFKEDIYLDHIRISSGGEGKIIFRVDLSEFNLPRDWTERVFWIGQSSYSGAFSRLPLEIERVKINVDNKEVLTN